MLWVEEAYHTRDSDLEAFPEVRHTSSVVRPDNLPSEAVVYRSTLKHYRSGLLHYGRGARIDMPTAYYSCPFKILLLSINIHFNHSDQIIIINNIFWMIHLFYYFCDCSATILPLSDCCSRTVGRPVASLMRIVSRGRAQPPTERPARHSGCSWQRPPRRACHRSPCRIAPAA